MSDSSALQTQSSHQTAIASHRGGAGLWPENSLTAFRNTSLMALDYVEFDVHLSLDGQLIVHHDPTLERMTNAEGPIASMPWAELQSVKVNDTGGEQLPLLRDVIAIFAPTAIDLRLEIKADRQREPYPGIEKKIAEELSAAGVLRRTVVSSFFLEALIRYRENASSKGLIWLVKPLILRQVGGIASVVRIAQDHQIDELALKHSEITENVVSAVRAAGLRLGAYATNDADAIQRMLELGVSVFTTDRPDVALRLRKAMNGS
ncbi:glycerophosphodiester phosphodiesterase family protein [Pelagibius sp.]|uniref:glycerophosphodiester phosphodiesterase family protein n=1 Tax=Pelagibius sp. TaxID=1931238 RepID=UPI003BAF917C